MPASIFATSGAILSIGQVLASKSTDFVLADFSAISWTAINWVENLGQFGDEAAEITFDAIGEGRTQKLKGNRNAGNMELVIGVDADDDGQLSLIAAEQTFDDYAFKIEFNDAPSGGTPSERYFIAKVMSVREAPEGANNVVRLNVRLGINSNIVKVHAAD